VAFGAGVYFLLTYLRDFNLVAYVVVAAFLLKSTFSVRELGRAAHRVGKRLVASDIDGARRDVKALVSRDPSGLDETLLASAAVESVAENASDSAIAPLLYFALLGIPGAVAYRVVNTFDAMIGYHGDFEYLGKFAARADDLLNFVPSRLTALLLVSAAWLLRRDARAAWRVMLRQGRSVESPNAGWPMSATAGALGVRLEKPRHYTLGETVNALGSDTIHESVRLAMVAICLALVPFYLAEVARYAIAS
jgi:adenosylcobinamide-phosphate synthase